MNISLRLIQSTHTYLPSIQDHHRHLGVLLQPGENCLSRGFHFCLAASLYLAQDSPISFAHLEKDNFCKYLKAWVEEKWWEYFQHIKKIVPSLNFISPFWVKHTFIIVDILVNYLTLFLLVNGRAISTEISLCLRLFASVMCPMQWEFSTPA